jgi:6-pyruvoyltetrahydropterin/6-carboxytetrahydropterin synthase
VYLLSVEHEFCAAHAIVVAGTRERTHGHNWRVTATVEGDALDADGLLCDFHAVERALRDVCGPFRDGDLNATPPFDRVNPTAEALARHLADALAAAIDPALRGRARVASVRVTEAPGCAATYRRP